MRLFLQDLDLIQFSICLPSNGDFNMQFLWAPFIMGSAILAVLQIMKHLVWNFIYNLLINNSKLSSDSYDFSICDQGKTRKHLRFLRVAGPLTAVVMGTTLAKVLNLPSISLVSNYNKKKLRSFLGLFVTLCRFNSFMQMSYNNMLQTRIILILLQCSIN